MAKITRIMVAPLAVNCYIIATEQHNAVAIDAGGSVPKILQFLQDNGLTLQKILLTHGHYDHIGGVAELQAATGAEVYIHEADAPMLSDSNLNLEKWITGETETTPISEYHAIHDGDTIVQDECVFHVLHTQGTPRAVSAISWTEHSLPEIPCSAALVAERIFRAAVMRNYMLPCSG